MSKLILEELFDSKARVKILKFFFRNETGYFNIATISDRVQEKKKVIKREIEKLLRIGIIQKRILKKPK